MMSGSEQGKAAARPFMELMGHVEDYGEDEGAANVVKLCGNFLIAVREPPILPHSPFLTCGYSFLVCLHLASLSLASCLLQSSIEAIGESMALAEKNGVNRQQVMGLLSSTIFDCLIYKVSITSQFSDQSGSLHAVCLGPEHRDTASECPTETTAREASRWSWA